MESYFVYTLFLAKISDPTNVTKATNQPCPTSVRRKIACNQGGIVSGWDGFFDPEQMSDWVQLGAYVLTGSLDNGLSTSGSFTG